MQQIPLVFEMSGAQYTSAELARLTPDDIWAIVDQTTLERLREDPRIERKRSIHAGELGEYFSMWANTVPFGGIMVIGQENAGGFGGCLALGDEVINKLESGGRFHCPDARTEPKRVRVQNLRGEDDFVLLIRVFYNSLRVVKTISDRAFIRSGSVKNELSREQIRELEYAKGQGDYEQQPSGWNFPDDFNLSLVREYTESLIRQKKLSSTHTVIELLSQTRLGRISGDVFNPNFACVLLFAKDPLLLFPGCKVQILRYDGDRELTGKDYNVIKDIWIEGPIPEVITKAARELRSQLREFSSLHDDGRFYVVPEYPEEAWYEALVNACVHRSYVLKNMVVFVKIFDDRMTIESPGGFPVNVSPETIYVTHSPRNPHLMTALYFLAFVKCHNEGTRRMRDSMDQVNLPAPEFAQKELASGFNSVRVTLRNNFKLRKVWVDSEAVRVLGPQWKDLKQNELRILNFVAEHEQINVTQAMRLISSPRKWQSVKKLLDNMATRGLLVHHHSKTVERDSHACYKLPIAED
jgi:ATP-dependent DNA helicase RecG